MIRKRNKPQFAVRRAEPATKFARWSVVETATGRILSTHARKANANALAGLAESVQHKYGSVDA